MEDESVERFKLWPTFRDRKQYEMAMTAGSVDALRERFPSSFTQTGNLRKIGIDHPPALEAIMFFHDSMLDWVRDPSEGDIATRSIALASAVLTDLSIVCISLHLNRQPMQLDTWDEQGIAARGEALADLALKIWPGPV